MVRVFIIFSFFLASSSFGQTTESVDSIQYYGAMYIDTNNYCNGGSWKSIEYLDKNFLIVGITEEKVIEVLGPNRPEIDSVYRFVKNYETRQNGWIAGDFDYYISYRYSWECFDGVQYLFPGSSLRLFFKDEILVGKLLFTRG